MRTAIDGEAGQAAAPWHVVTVVGGSDRHALDWLDRCGVEYCYPMMRELRAVARKDMTRKQRASGLSLMRPTLVPMFPRYVFCRLDRRRADLREVFAFAGLGGLVCAGGLPVAVDDALIVAILRRSVDGAVPASVPAHLVFAPGDRVTVATGALRGVQGIVERGTLGELDPAGRIRLAIDVFGRPTPLEIGADQVERV